MNSYNILTGNQIQAPVLSALKPSHYITRGLADTNVQLHLFFIACNHNNVCTIWPNLISV